MTAGQKTPATAAPWDPPRDPPSQWQERQGWRQQLQPAHQPRSRCPLWGTAPWRQRWLCWGWWVTLTGHPPFLPTQRLPRAGVPPGPATSRRPSPAADHCECCPPPTARTLQVPQGPLQPAAGGGPLPGTVPWTHTPRWGPGGPGPWRGLQPVAPASRPPCGTPPRDESLPPAPPRPPRGAGPWAPCWRLCLCQLPLPAPRVPLVPTPSEETRWQSTTPPLAPRPRQGPAWLARRMGVPSWMATGAEQTRTGPTPPWVPHPLPSCRLHRHH